MKKYFKFTKLLLIFASILILFTPTVQNTWGAKQLIQYNSPKHFPKNFQKINEKNLSKNIVNTNRADENIVLNKTVNSFSSPIKNNKNVFDDDIFKIYKKAKNFKFAPDGNSNFNSIVGVKISGLPKNDKNEVVIKEINFISDDDNKKIEYQIPYIRNWYDDNFTKKNHQIKSLDDNEDLLGNNSLIANKINDGSYSSGVKIKGVNSPLGLEFNFLFTKPTNLNDIRLSLDLNSSLEETWNKIGSIVLLDKDGNVYRRDGISLSKSINSDYANDDALKKTRIVFTGKRNKKIYKDSISLTNKNVPVNLRGSLTKKSKDSAKEYVVDYGISNQHPITIINNVDLSISPKNFHINYSSWTKKEVDEKGKIKNYLDYDFYNYFSKTKNENLLKSSSKNIKIPNPNYFKNETLPEINIALIGGSPLFLKFKWVKISDNKYSLILINSTLSHNIKNNNTSEDQGILIIKLINTWYKKADKINFSVKESIPEWEYFSSDNTLNNDASLQVMMSIKFDPSVELNSYFLFIGSLNIDKSIVPIYRTMELTLIKMNKDSNTKIYSKNISINLSKEEKYGLFLKISDPSMRQSIINSLNLTNVKNIDFNDINTYLISYNNKKKILKDSSETKLFAIDFSISSMGNTIDTNTLDLYSYLSYFSNIFKISYTYVGNYQFPYTYYISDISWMSNIVNLKKINFSRNASRNKNIHLDGVLANIPRILTNLDAIEEMDLTSYWSSISNENPLLSLSQDLSNRISHILKIIFPMRYKDELFKVIEHKNKFLKSWNIKYIDTDHQTRDMDGKLINMGNFFQINSKNLDLVENPKILYSSTKNKYYLSTIKFNDKNVIPAISGGQKYWDWKASKIFNFQKISWKINKTNKYYSDNYVNSKNIDKKDLIPVKLGVTRGYQKSPFTIPYINNLRNINIEDTINVDGNKVGIKLYNGIPFFSFPINSIKYVYIDDLGAAFLYTSLDTIINIHGLNKVDSLNLFSYTPPQNSYSEYSKLKNNVIPNIKDLKNPELWINNIKISDLIIIAGKYFWRIPDSIKISDIKYMKDNNKFYTSYYLDGKYIQGLISIQEADYSNYPTDDLYEINNYDKIKTLSQLNDAILVDGKIIKRKLKNNIMYYDYDLTKVKFVILNKLDNKKNNYYTSLSNLPKDYDPKKLYSLKRPKRNNGIISDIFPTPPINAKSKLYISVDKKSYSTTLRYGTWFWDIPHKLLNLISFVNQNNEYFTKISDEDLKLDTYSSVTIKKSDVAPNKKLITFPQKISKNNINLLNEYYLFNGIKRNFIVKDSKIYISDSDYSSANYIIVDSKKPITLYSSLKDIKNEEIKFSWSYNRQALNPDNQLNGYKGELIVEPKDNNSGNLFIINNGKTIKIIIVERDEKKYYVVDNNLISKIKWIDKKTGFYYTNSNDIPLNSNELYSVDLASSNIEKFIKTKAKIFKKQIKNNRVIGLIISLSFLITSIGSLSALAIGKKLLERNKKWN